MFRKIVKGIGIGIGSLLILLISAYTFVYVQTQSRISKQYTVKVAPLSIPADSAAYTLGSHLAAVRGCKGCHGADLGGGRAIVNENSPIGILYATNLTRGKGGIEYSDADWVRALRHGLGKDNRSLWFMPSHEICLSSDKDLAAIISYAKQQPVVDRIVPAKEIKPLGRILTFLGKLPLLPAEKIDHNAAPIADMKPAITAEYGKYLAVTCSGCHTPTFKGAPAHSPNEPPIPDLTRTGPIGRWSEADFVALFHTQKTPDGRQISPAMPIKELGLTNDELKAIYLYLHGLP